MYVPQAKLIVALDCMYVCMYVCICATRYQTSTYAAANLVHFFVSAGDEPNVNGGKGDDCSSYDKVVKFGASQLHNPAWRRRKQLYMYDA